jgi:hypothetical protein
MTPDEQLAVCDVVPKWLAAHGEAAMCSGDIEPKDAAELTKDVTAICTALPAALRRVQELEEQAKMLRDQLADARYLGDNHHNAMACPHCNPTGKSDAAKLAAVEAVCKSSVTVEVEHGREMLAREILAILEGK